MVPNKKTSLGIFAASLVAFAPVTSSAQSEPYRTPQWLQASSGVRAAQVTDRLIVKFKSESANALPSGAVRAKALTASAGKALRHVRSMHNQTEVMGLPTAVSNEEARRIAAQVAANPNVEYAQPDYRMFPAATPNDPGFSPGIPFLGGVLVKQWYLSDPVGGINAPAAWDVTQGSSTTTIAVIDTGILNHIDLAGRLVPGYDFIGADANGLFETANDGDGRDSDATDPGNWITPAEAGRGNFAGCPTAVDSDWHGTHVAGILAANTDNGQRIAGINWFARILPIRALGKCGGYTSDIIDGMRWAAGMAVNGVPPNTNPARIINLSLGLSADSAPPACSLSLQDAITDVVARGATVVVAAGNAREDSVTSMPANCAGVISVAASLKTGQFASSYSNFGPLITLSAPGGLITDPADAGQDGILSLNDRGVTVPENDDAVAVLFGTSFSTAIVSGVASLLLDVNPNLTPAQIKAILQSTSRRLSDPNDKGLDCLIVANRPCYQYVVDAAAAVDEAGFPILSVLNSNRNDVSLLDFGRQTSSGATAPIQLIVRNPAGVAIRIFGIRIAGKDQNDFNADTTCFSNSASGRYPFDLGATDECSIDVTFTSRGNNVRAADVVIASQFVDIPIALTGSGPATSGGDGGGGGGGGCALGGIRRIDPTLWLLLVISIAYLARRRIARG